MKTSSTIRAPGLRAGFRLVSQNVLIAVMVAAVPALYISGNWYPRDRSGLIFTWWSMPATCAVIAIPVVRALRRGVLVTDSALIVRSVPSTRVLPWRCFESCRTNRVGRRTRMLNGECDGQKVAVLVYDRESLALEPTVDRAMSDAGVDEIAREPSPVAYPHGEERDGTVWLWIFMAVLLVGIQVIESPRHDRDLYAARAARDVTGTAQVMDSHIDEDDDGEHSPTYTTVVDIRFVVGERQVDTTIERPGRWKFPQELRIPIVYDSMHPRSTPTSATGTTEGRTTRASACGSGWARS